MTSEHEDAAPGTETSDPVEPAELLGELTRLRRRARSARHAYWFPLVLFGLLTCAALPFYVMSGTIAAGVASETVTAGGPDLPIFGGSPGFLVGNYLGYYWLAAIVAGVGLTALWYRRHGRQVGLVTPARGYVITGAALTIAALLLPLLSRVQSLQWLRFLWPGDLVIRGTFPFLIIAAGLWALAWAERSRALAVIALIYTGAALLASLYDIENVLFDLGWQPTAGQWRLTGLPNVLLPALILLIAGAGAFTFRRRRIAA